MNYKLAKQLKEAGFPQETKQAYVLSSGGKEEHRNIQNMHSGGYINLLSAGYEVVSKPTLEEVIEECGDDLEGIEKMETGGWGAYTYSKKWANSIGVTHLEAVSNLYIKLTRNNKA